VSVHIVSQIKEDGRSLVDDDTSPRRSVVLEDAIEPNMLKARPTALLLDVVSAADGIVSEATGMEESLVEPTVEEVHEPEIAEPIVPVVSEKEINDPVVLAPKELHTRPITPPPKVNTSSRQPAASVNRTGRNWREKSGVLALDRYLSDAIDEDTEAIEAERDEDDDWDFVEAADGKIGMELKAPVFLLVVLLIVIDLRYSKERQHLIQELGWDQSRVCRMCRGRLWYLKWRSRLLLLNVVGGHLDGVFEPQITTIVVLRQDC
jgi:hypothetical protein